MPLFSIITVSLNPGPLLAETIESVLAQTFQDYEILIKDGGSSALSWDQWKHDPRVRCVVQADQGIFDAMNKALPLTSGQFIQYLNCGDTLEHPDVLTQVAHAIRKFPDIPFFYGDIRKPNSRRGFTFYPDRLTPAYLYIHRLCHQVWFARRDLYERHPLPTGSALGGDDIWLKERVVGEGMRHRRIPDVLVHYRGGGVSETPALQRTSEPYRNAATRRLYTPWQRLRFGLKRRLRHLLKSTLYDPFLWRLVRWREDKRNNRS